MGVPEVFLRIYERSKGFQEVSVLFQGVLARSTNVPGVFLFSMENGPYKIENYP